MTTRTESQIKADANNIKRQLDQLNRELANKANRNINKSDDPRIAPLNRRKAAIKLQLGKLSEELQQLTRNDTVRNRRQDLGDANVTEI